MPYGAVSLELCCLLTFRLKSELISDPLYQVGSPESIVVLIFAETFSTKSSHEVDRQADLK